MFLFIVVSPYLFIVYSPKSLPNALVVSGIPFFTLFVSSLYPQPLRLGLAYLLNKWVLAVIPVFPKW